MISGTSGLGTADPPSMLRRLLSLLPLHVIGWGQCAVCPLRGEKTLPPFSKISKRATRSLTRARRMLQNNTFVFLLCFFLGLALSAGGLLSRAGRASGPRRHPSARRCSARCASPVCLDPLGGLLLSLLHTGPRTLIHTRAAEL